MRLKWTSLDVAQEDLSGKFGYLGIFNDDGKVFLSILHENLCCGCSLETPCRGDSNEHQKHRFL